MRVYLVDDGLVGVEDPLDEDDRLRFQGGLAFQVHRLVYHSTTGSREMNKKKKMVVCFWASGLGVSGLVCRVSGVGFSV